MSVEKSLSVVVPYYGGADKLQKLIRDFSAWQGGGFFHSVQLIIVDDGHFSASKLVEATGLSEKNCAIRVIVLKKNLGQHAATWIGYQMSNSDYVFTCDVDTLAPVSILEKLYRSTGFDADIVYATVKKLNPPLVRKIGGALLKLLVSIFHPGILEITSLRLIRKRTGTNAAFSTGDVFDFWLEANQMSARFIPGVEQEYSKSSYSPVKLLRVTWSIINARRLYVALLAASLLGLCAYLNMNTLLLVILFTLMCFVVWSIPQRKNIMNAKDMVETVSSF